MWHQWGGGASEPLNDIFILPSSLFSQSSNNCVDLFAHFRCYNSFHSPNPFFLHFSQERQAPFPCQLLWPHGTPYRGRELFRVGISPSWHPRLGKSRLASASQGQDTPSPHPDTSTVFQNVKPRLGISFSLGWGLEGPGYVSFTSKRLSLKMEIDTHLGSRFVCVGQTWV